MDVNQGRRFQLLLVDDEATILAALKRVFRKSPYSLHTAENGLDALDLLEQKPIDAAIIDMKMPRMDGLELLERIGEKWPQVRTVMLTGYGGVREAVTAIKLGAVDFLQKPYEDEKLRASIAQIHQMWALEQENRRLKEQMHFTFGFDQLIGNSPAMLSMKRMILQVGPSDAPVLVQGETGSGKELVARAIHHHSTRQGQPFVPVDCGSISETVSGSELFGHVKGAFTGAHETTAGLIRSADGGTLFLDEVGELSLSMQVKLLRTIQEKEVRPVGASTSHPVDVRFLAATNRDLEKEVAEGRFRQDLYYRLNVVVIDVPSLRDRRDDIALLARHFLQQFQTPAGSVLRVSKEAVACMTAYEWPGNVRELENVLRRAVAMGQDEAVMPGDLPETIHAASGSGNGTGPADNPMPVDSLAAYEYAAICNALEKNSGNRKRAARMLGIGEATLYRKLKKYNL